MIKFLMIPILFSSLFSLAVNKMEVIKKPLSTKNKSTPNVPLGVMDLKKELTVGPKSKGNFQCSRITKITAKALSVSSPLIYFMNMTNCRTY